MILIPAIDLLDGRCVRLRQGDFSQCNVYPDAPAQIAQHYAAAGAEWLHVVDLAASRDGADADASALFQLLANVTQKVQTGGGVRTAEDIQRRLDAGASRVVVGSLAADDPRTFSAWLARFGSGSLIAALDVRVDAAGSPRVRSHGWTRDSGRILWELLEFYSQAGLRHLLCTDIGCDGSLAGPNLELYRQIADRHPTIALQASGGIRDVSDLQALAAAGAAAAISGKALLDGCFNVGQAIEALGGAP